MARQVAAETDFHLGRRSSPKVGIKGDEFFDPVQRNAQTLGELSQGVIVEIPTRSLQSIELADQFHRKSAAIMLIEYAARASILTL